MEQQEQHVLDNHHSGLLSSLSWWKLKMISKIIHVPENAAMFHDEEVQHEPESSSAVFSWLPPLIIRRFLAETGGDSYDLSLLRMDYSVLAVGVLTLGLILVVEVLRHKLDHMAHNRPYFTAVLENVYAELATLGIVEFFLFVLQTYYKDMDKAKKGVFGMVHFALFYTAILNALQAAILAFFTMRVSRRLWVQTEALELNHYVEIREEFERISQQLLELKQQQQQQLQQRASRTRTSERRSSSRGRDQGRHTNIDEKIINGHNQQEVGEHEHQQNDEEVNHAAATTTMHNDSTANDDNAELALEFNWNVLTTAARNTLDRIRYPRLKYRYNELLVQVRFHELRAHFVEAYNLPPKFWVSEYLMRSELSVLIKLVKVSTYAWLLLTASANLLYYVLGIVGTLTQDPETVGVALVYIFFGSMLVFIVVAMILYNKMKLVFKSIMHKEHLWQEAVAPTVKEESAATTTRSPTRRNKSIFEDRHGGGHHQSFHGSFRPSGHGGHKKKKKVHGELAREQLGLFWMSSPKLVITVIQFIQFGYAVALSVVIIFQDELESSDLVSNIGWYWFTVLFCYACFVAVAAQVIPRYTLCTSLGQLVDRQRLHETVAIFRLNEARRQHVEQLILQAYQKRKQQEQQKYVKQLEEEEDGGGFSDMLMLTSAPTSPLVAPDETSDDYAARGSGVSDDRKLGLASRSSKPGGSQVASEIPVWSEQPQTTASTTAISTNSAILSMREATTETSLVPGAPSPTGDGMTSVPELAKFSTITVEERAERRRRRKKSVSDGVALMSALGRANADAATPPMFTPLHLSGSFPESGGRASPPLGSALPSMAGDLALKTFPASGGSILPPRAERAARRRNRKKSVSDGVAFMAKVTSEEAMGSVAAGPLTSVSIAPRISQGVKKDVDTLPARIGDSARIAQLVKMDTAALRAALTQGELEKLDERKNQRSRRRKAVSTGVDSMARLLEDDNKKHNLLPQRDPHVRRNSGSLSDLAAEMLSPEDTQIENLRARKGRRRQKSVSDGVALMASLAHIHFESATDLTAAVKTTDDITPHDMAKMVTNSVNSSLLIRPEANVAAAAAIIQIQGNNSADEGALLDVVDEDHDENEVDETENSICSVASGYCRSDVDDLPEVNIEELAVAEHRNVVSFRDRCRRLFLDKRFVVTSNVFGTMTVFFFVAERVERFLHTENILPPGFISFDINETITFWLLSTWLYLFLIVDCFIFYSLGQYGRLETAHERDIFVSGVIDAVIVSVCLTVFYVAEAKRCCDPTARRRGLADYTYPDYGPAPCNCPAFGTRLYGGLGTIEPYTSLIAFRLFRFWAATYIVRRLAVRQGKSKEDDLEQVEVGEEQLDPFDVYNSAAAHGHGHEEEKGTAAELWEATVGRHPDLVAKHGEFSREVLMAMLGIPLVGQEEIHHEDPKLPMDSGDHPLPHLAETGNAPPRPSFHLDEQYSTLPVEAQEIIMSGKLGVRVRSVANLHAFDTKSPNASADEIDANHFFTPKIHGTAFEVAPLSPPGVDVVLQNAFDSPNATLVRSMRRADRKLPPMLSSWTAVDVILTRFEIVYFDATNVDDEDITRDPARNALIATKGGKGLRLCDVAVGRRVVGRLPMSDVTAISVEREMPSATVREGDNPYDEVIQTEYWHSKPDAVHVARSDVWHTIKQDSLAVQTSHGHTLYLRFYSDLEDAGHHPERLIEENEVEGPLRKNNAFQWVQTIGRQCGQEQLEQLLPHFGDNSDNELRDYLVVKTTEDERKGHRRGRSRASLLVTRPMSSMRRNQSTDGGVVSDGSDHRGSAGRRIVHRLLRSSSSGVEADGVDPARPVLIHGPPISKSSASSRGPNPSTSGTVRFMDGVIVASTSTPDKMPPTSKAPSLTMKANSILQHQSPTVTSPCAAEMSAQNGIHASTYTSPLNGATPSDIDGSYIVSFSNDQSPSKEDTSGPDKVNMDNHEISPTSRDVAPRNSLAHPLTGSDLARWLDPAPAKVEQEKGFGQFVDP